MVDHARSARLTVSMVADVFTVTADNLDTAVQELNRLNVFPIADGDTGTNMAATMRPIATAALEATARDAAGGSETDSLGGDDDATARFSDAVTRAGLRSARGNSGLILSQFLTGFASSLGDPSSTGGSLSDALRSASTRARDAVSEPVDGTMLTVAAEAASAIEGLIEAEPETSVHAMAALVRTAAHRATAETTTQLAVLAKHGVVDAGAVGLTHFFDALHAVTALELVGGPDSARAEDRARSENTPFRSLENETDDGDEPALVGYEFTFVLDAESSVVGGEPTAGERTVDALAASLRTWLSARGDDVVVGSGAGLVKAHVHVGFDHEANDSLLSDLAATFGRVEDLRSEALVERRPDNASEGT